MTRTPPLLATRRAICLGLAGTASGLGARQAPAEEGWTTLVAGRRAVRLRPDAGQAADLWTFGESAPGPTVRVRAGAPLRLRFENRTDRPLSFHVYGLRGPNPLDGVGGLTGAPTPPGGSGTLEMASPPPGTYLIRPIVPGGSAEPAERGLSALLVIEERRPPAVDREVELLVDDWRLAPDGALAPFGDVVEAATLGRLGNWLTAGGEPLPRRIEAAPGARLRLRLANASNARVMPIRFEGLKAYVAAIDSVPTDTFEPLRATLPFPPGRRYDLIVEVPETGTGTLLAAIGPGVPIAVVAATGAKAGGAPGAPAGIAERPSLPPEIRLQNAARRDLALGGGARRTPEGARYDGDPARIWTVNGTAG
ncbi:MAG TPA: multicopper oxidase domain-containing protein, partial [Salinarimonas sp.]|nr:multicopper oxidase domain-containing protein [Salinarimonas sp.]